MASVALGQEGSEWHQRFCDRKALKGSSGTVHSRKALNGISGSVIGRP